MTLEKGERLTERRIGETGGDGGWEEGSTKYRTSVEKYIEGIEEPKYREEKEEQERQEKKRRQR